MIVPMKKVSLIVREDKKSQALKELRKLGIIQIEIASGKGSRLEELREQTSVLENALFTLGKIKSEQESLDTEKALSVAKEILALEEQKKEYQAKITALSAEIDRLSPWGEIDPEAINELKAKGYEISLYEMPKTEYERLKEETTALLLEETKASVKAMALVCPEAQLSSFNGYRLALPQLSTENMRKEITEISSLISAAQEKISSYGQYSDALKEAIKSIARDIEFEVYSTGMDKEALTDELTIAYFTGYIEAENLEKLTLTAHENCWGLLVEEPTEEDNVPTKLKNNKFVSLIYPLTDFLGTVPGYFEYDISGWFLGFILIFFGIIFGDGGYGLLITAVAAIPIIKALCAKKPVSPMFLLIGLFGLSTVLWGTLTCTWFGLSAQQLPAWLQSLSIPVISNVYADKIWYPFWTNGQFGLTTAQNLQILCFTLALIQLTVAHIKGALRNKRSIKVLGDIGSILQLIGIYYIVLSLVVNPQVFSFGLVIGGVPVGTVAIVLIAVGFVLSFVFSNYEGSIIKSILASLANIVSVLLGIVNVFSDIVSYIRLWAVGLAGAAISATVNELAGPLLGNFLFMIVAIIILVFGHGLNMILNVLSVIVHGIRLNTLEFSSHLDMSWSGHKFKPFK